MSLDSLVGTFNDMRGALLDEMERMDAAALVATPLAGKWSILEIIEHLVLAERAVFKGLPDPSQLVAREIRVAHLARYQLVMFILRSGIPVRVPSPAMAPQGNRSLAELRRLWDENQDWLASCIAHLGPKGIRRAVLEHPVVGPMTVEMAVRMGQVHVRGHIRQIQGASAPSGMTV